MYSLLLLSSLLHITTCTVYTVTPDDHYYPNTTCHHCHNLQHYLLNITKYFTSNTQLLFLSGLHHLHTHLIIQNVHNISLIGSTANSTTLDTVIQLQGNLSTIFFFNITKLTIRNIIINISYHDNGKEVINCLPEWIPLSIKDCSFVFLHDLQVYPIMRSKLLRCRFLMATNVMGESHFSHVTFNNGVIQLFYNEAHADREYHSLSINNCTVKGINLTVAQNSYSVTLRIINMRVQHNVYLREGFINAEKLGMAEVRIHIINCQFVSNVHFLHELFLLNSTSNASVKFINCQFLNNSIRLSDMLLAVGDLHRLLFALNQQSLINKCNESVLNYTLINMVEMPYLEVGNLDRMLHGLHQPSLINQYGGVNLEFNNCNFHGMQKILQTDGNKLNPTKIVIKNTNYSYVSLPLFPPILLSHTTLVLEGLVNFHHLKAYSSIILLSGNSTVIISGTVKFSHNHAYALLDLYNNNNQYIILKENSFLSINHNEVWSLFHTISSKKYPHPFCFFQYIINPTRTAKLENRDFQIKFYNNVCKFRSAYTSLLYGSASAIPITSCHQLPQSSFHNITPSEVNDHYMKYINNSGDCKILNSIEQSSLCMCTNELHYDCHINDLGYLYPGQTLTASLYHHKGNYTTDVVVVKTDIDQQHATPCIVLDINENSQIINKQCTELHYTIGFPTDNYCELFLKLASDSDDYLNIFYVKQITCPTGFVKIHKRCQCDPVLVQYGITNCNINNQTILRPANSWISTATNKNNYQISLNCPFHYCLFHSSHLNFSTPNSQCQFNRSGLLCGYCQQDLSTVFSSFHCQHCSSIYVLLIIPIAIAGLVLVLLLFVLNLTVTDGTINGFILYVNIISINTSIFFTEINHFTPTYTFISLANLDLGIQTCFYNGMDDYAKMWLQLAFPFYLIFIATLIIITSRYSITIQRITARRALPVLATLFLLSYTKILRIVSSVLFFYSTIIHLPSKHTTLVWSVDANVPLFGVRFTILFIVCLILFLILVPFNVILLFTRTLSKFRFINRFKPLLDAYQGPYKDKFYYWTGLQLLIRSVFFGISSLDRNINITISLLLLSVIIGVHGVIRPFKIKYKSYQEMLIFFNLHGLYVILLYSQLQGVANTTAVNVAITVAAVHFSFIILYHSITYVWGGVIRNKIQSSVNTFTGWITRLYKKSQPQQFQLQNNIPEVAFNYHDYREPLIGIDC